MSWHPKINTARRTALKKAAKKVKKESVEERLAAVEELNVRVSAIEGKVETLEATNVSAKQ